VPSGARSRNLLFHRQALCQLSYRHQGRRRGGRGWESKPSSVPDGHLSRPPEGPATSSPSWRLSTSGLGEPPASGRFGDCCGEDCPFHPGKPVWSLLLSRGLPRANLDCRRAVSRAPPRLSPGTRALCSSDFPLAPKRQRPSLPTPCLGCQCAGRLGWQGGRVLRCRGNAFTPSPCHPAILSPQGPRCRRGDLNSHEVTLTTP
jgi:hypothetical protein